MLFGSNSGKSPPPADKSTELDTEPNSIGGTPGFGVTPGTTVMVDPLFHVEPAGNPVSVIGHPIFEVSAKTPLSFHKLRSIGVVVPPLVPNKDTKKLPRI